MCGNGLLWVLYSDGVGASPAMNLTACPWKPARPWFPHHRRHDSRWSQHLTPSRWGAGTAAYFTKWMFLFFSVLFCFFSHQCASCGEARLRCGRSWCLGSSRTSWHLLLKERSSLGKKKYSSRLWWVFNIRCCLFEILSLWLDQKFQMIRTRPPKHPQSDE